jgi:tyrosine-protein kinase Etk/Wzc
MAMNRGTGSAKPTGKDDEVHLRDIWNILVRNWILITLILLATVGGTAAYTYYTAPVYQSTTSIRIQERQADLPVLDVLQNLSGGSEVETEMEVLRSRTLAEDVVGSLALQVVPVSPRGVARSELLQSLYVERWAPEGEYVLKQQEGGVFDITDQDGSGVYGTVSSRTSAALPGATFTLVDGAEAYDQIVVEVFSFDEAVEDLESTVTVARPNREASIVTVRYESSDTQLVHLVPNTLADRFIAQGQAVRKTEATSTVGFLEQQIETLSGQLAAAEGSLTAFREGEQVVSIQAEAQSQVTQLTRLQAERNIIEAERAALQQLVSEINDEARSLDPSAPSPYTRLISFPTLFRNQAASEFLRNLNEANSERSRLLIRRTMEDPDVINVTERVGQIELQLRTTVETYLQGLTNQVSSYDATLREFGIELERIPAKEVQLTRLFFNDTATTEIYTLLQTRLQEARILEAVEDATVRIVDPAILPTRPVRPRTLLNLLLAFLVGAMLGASVAFAREYLDETVHTREDIAHATGGATVLGVIPRIRLAAVNGRSAPTAVPGELSMRLVAGRDPRNPVSEAYRTLRTNLTFSNPDKPPKTIVFTSALPKDGKSTSAANLSITLAQQGINALLVDADLRRGELHTVFGVPNEPGLTNILTGTCGIGEAIREIDLGESGTLAFLPSGPYPPNPAEILGSQKMRTLVEALEERFDLVILDSAPLTVATDAAVLGTKADGAVLVARASVTEKGALSYAVEQLNNVRASILGCILNDVDFRRDSRYSGSYGKYGYYYQYYYDDDRKDGKSGRRSKKNA